MIDWPLVLIVLAAVVVLGGLLGLAAWWYLPPANLPGQAGPDVSAVRGPSGLAGEFHTDERPPDYEPWGTCDWGDCDEIAEAWRFSYGHGWLPVCENHAEYDDWADQLHEINQLGKFGDLTRPVAHLTHYEVEALIRTLAVPEWVPDRYRMAA